MTKRTNIHALSECALMIAASTVLSMIKIWEQPWGGSVTLLSMLPLILVSLRWGTRWGLLTAFVHSLLQMLLGFYAPPANTVIAFIGVILLDYVLAFTSLGSANIFAHFTKNRTANACIASSIACFLRFICSFLSGALLWGSYQSYYEWADGMSVWLYSFIYNGTYMLVELVLTTIGAALLVRFAPKLFERQQG